MSRPIPVIDLFAGPGGLGEGFSAYGTSAGHARFKIALSIERDPVAHRTLQLRSFFRQLDSRGRADYYLHLGHPDGFDARGLFEQHPAAACEAASEAWCMELRPDTANEIGQRITRVLRGANPWILIGGPPCQAYSLVGRSRNRGIEGYIAEDDPRQYLYREYLQIIADHAPAVFVMENVKGLLSATLAGERVFTRIRGDLERPTRALQGMRRSTSGDVSLQYDVYSLLDGRPFADDEVQDYVVRAEQYGIPQCRHRVILVGVQRGLKRPRALTRLPLQMHIEHAIDDLPPLRSGLTHTEDGRDEWKAHLRQASESIWCRDLRRSDGKVAELLIQTAEGITAPKADRGQEYLVRPSSIGQQRLHDWLRRDAPPAILNHTARGHMAQDLHRYLFAACFGQIHGHSPELCHFPKALWPAHKNVERALRGGHFADRFRVQVRGRPSTTVVSHISKDGHYYIHPDPRQCRSLTVREAARLQTFPDNYFFCGNRTQQYHQVGNAVPPLLAYQIADVVYDLLK